VLVISFFVSTIGLMGLGSSPVAADPTGSVIAVVVDRITPIAPQPGDTLRISGKLLNSSDSVLTKISARLGISASPLEKRAQVAEQSELELNPEAEPIDYFLDKTKVSISDALQPGDGANFEVSIPVNDLPLGRDGVYALMVEVLGADGSGNVRRQGGFRTFMPWMGPDSNPIDLVWLWPLIDYPAQEANKVLLNDEVPRSLAPGGRLDSLLTVGADNADKVSWVADPQLLQVSQDMARGYQVRNGQSLSVGDLSAESGLWISRLTDALLASQDLDSVKSGKNDHLPLC
jgi:hypothetical protein